MKTTLYERKFEDLKQFLEAVSGFFERGGTICIDICLAPLNRKCMMNN
jgi:hypothetical protein